MAAMLHALWAFSLQALMVVVTAAIVAVGFRWRDDPRARLALWRMVLAAAVLLPLVGVLRPAPAHGALETRIPLEGIVTSMTRAVDAPALGSDHAPALFLLILVAGVGFCACRLAVSWYALRRFAQGADLRLDLFEDLQSRMGAHARLVACPVVQPFTFGRRAPVVVVPERFPREPEPVQRAVLAHELSHVRRGDWLHAIVEDVLCVLLWFHPGVWWAVRELRLAREEIVDREAARIVGSRRVYMRTLLDFADRRDEHALRAITFFRQRQLARRIAALSKEVSMSTRHLVLSGMAAAFLLTMAVHAAQAAFPMITDPPRTTTVPPQDVSQPSALEQQAYQVPKDAPPPRKVGNVPLPYPEDIQRSISSAVFGVRLVIDVDGSVAEARILTRKIAGPPTPPEQLADAVERLSASTLRTVRQWTFEPPAKAPLATTIAVSYDAAAKAKEAPPPPPPPPPPGAGSVTRPVPINQPNPVYTADALTAGIQGVVVVAVTVASDGSVKDARIVKSVSALDQAALDAVRKWTFRPGTRDGEPVDVTVDIAMEFRLRD